MERDDYSKKLASLEIVEEEKGEEKEEVRKRIIIRKMEEGKKSRKAKKLMILILWIENSGYDVRSNRFNENYRPIKSSWRSRLKIKWASKGDDKNRRTSLYILQPSSIKSYSL